MESKRLYKDEQSSLDIISTLPQAILEIILCLLPTNEAARTSILSREWRYKWTKLSKLEFVVPLMSKSITNEKQVQGKNTNERWKPFYDLHQVLLSHRGLIHEFSLLMDQSTVDQDSYGFDQVVHHLSKNHTLKKLKLRGLNGYRWYNLPISIYSLHHLTDLDLFLVNLDHQPIFNGFGSLRSLFLRNVGKSTKTLLHLLSNCPSLKTLTLLIRKSHHGVEDCTVIELFKCLPMIEHLTTVGHVVKWLVLDLVPQALSTSFSHLEYFCFKGMCFVDGQGLAFLLILIKCSPNMKKIKLEIDRHHTFHEEHPVVVWEEYSDVWLEHLNELKIKRFNNLKPEMEFVKFILARSPSLKKVSFRSSKIYMEERPEILRVLSEAPRASHSVCLNFTSKMRRSLNFLDC